MAVPGTVIITPSEECLLGFGLVWYLDNDIGSLVQNDRQTSILKTDPLWGDHLSNPLLVFRFVWAKNVSKTVTDINVGRFASAFNSVMCIISFAAYFQFPENVLTVVSNSLWRGSSFCVSARLVRTGIQEKFPCGIRNVPD